MAKDAKKAERAARKRREREKRVGEEKARRRAAQQAEGARAGLASPADLPLQECVISKGWRERGLAHVLLTRRNPRGRLAVAGYYVDTGCLGLKDTALLPDVAADEYEERVKPQIFNDPVEFEPCDPAEALGLIEGAIAYAGSLGFRANKRWPETRRLFQGVEARPPAGLSFGRGGRPCLLVRPGDKAAGARARLDRAVGPGNYAVVERE